MLRKILDHLKSDWYKYLIEIVVVMLGILIAYNLEQWGETRHAKAREIELLKDFKENLSGDLDLLHFNVWFHNTSMQCSKTVLRVIKEDLPYHDSLDVYFSYTHAFSSFEPKMSSIEQLKNSNSTTISNDSLRSAIISMYDGDFKLLDLLEQAVERDYQKLRDFDKLYFDAYDIDGTSTSKIIRKPLWGTMRPLLFTELKRKPEYAALLRAKISTETGLVRFHYNYREKMLVRLIARIDQEIRKLEQ